MSEKILRGTSWIMFYEGKTLYLGNPRSINPYMRIGHFETIQDAAKHTLEMGTGCKDEEFWIFEIVVDENDPPCFEIFIHEGDVAALAVLLTINGTWTVDVTTADGDLLETIEGIADDQSVIDQFVEMFV